MAEKMIAYCGLDCSKCDGYIATQSGDSKRLEEVAKEWSKQYNCDIDADDVVCDGCKAGKRKSRYCKNGCKIRVCCLKKAYSTCMECDEFPCKDEEYVLDNGLDVIENLKAMYCV